MRLWLVCAAAVIGVLGGCGTQPTVSDAGEPAPRPQRLGAGDSVGWSVHANHQVLTKARLEAGVDEHR